MAQHALQSTCEAFEALALSRSALGLPVIDMSYLQQSQDHQVFVQSVCKAALQGPGAFIIKNHMVNIESMRHAGASFFNLGDAETIGLTRGTPGTQQRYLRVNNSHTKEIDSNAWQEHLSETDVASLDAGYDIFLALSMRVLEMIVESFGGNSKEVTAAFNCPQQTSKLDVNFHPPAIASDMSQNVTLFEHTDSALLTILCPDDRGGLEILDPVENVFLEVPSLEGGLIVFVGEALSKLLDSRVSALKHKVVPKTIFKDSGRMSLQFQARPKIDFVLHSSIVGLEASCDDWHCTFVDFLTWWYRDLCGCS